jgi:hypothetical protein
MQVIRVMMYVQFILQDHSRDGRRLLPVTTPARTARAALDSGHTLRVMVGSCQRALALRLTRTPANWKPEAP